MSAVWHAYDYAVLRVVPRVHLETTVPVGVVLHARTAAFLDVCLIDDEERLAACCHGALDPHVLRRHLDAYARIARGEAAGDPIGALPPSERFHWLTAPRSTVLQPAPLHPGRTRAPSACLRHLFATLVHE